MQAGEILRRTAFVALDMVRGGKLDKIKKVNKREIVDGVTREYLDRRGGRSSGLRGKTFRILQRIQRRGGYHEVSGNDKNGI